MRTFAAAVLLGVALTPHGTRAQAPPPPAADVMMFGGNAQHTSIYNAPASDISVIRWSTSIDRAQSFRNAHYGAPVVTNTNVIFVPTKTAADGFEIGVFDAASGAPRLAAITTDYILPAHNWYPTYQPALAKIIDPAIGTVNRVYYAGAGGTLWFVDRPDTFFPTAPVRRAFFGLNAYQANPNAFNATVFINTPLTTDSRGNVFFGFRVQGTAPAPLLTTQSGFARVAPDGTAAWVLAGPAAADGNISRDTHNSAPALSHDESLLYVVAKSAATNTYGYLLALDATTLETRHRVFLRDPRGGGANNAGISDDSTASPTVAPDDDVYLGVQGNPGNGSRGFLLRFSRDLSVEKTPGGFGWDSTAAIVPAGMVPSYTGNSSYLIFAKYNNYATADGDGVNRIALLDPDSTQVDPHPSANRLVQMREVLTVIGPTPDRDRVSSTFPHAVREWCINTAAVNPATRSIFAPNEDGYLYRWDLATNSLAQAVQLTPGFLEPYVPTIVGPDGTVFTLNGGTLFAVGRAGGIVTLESSRGDVRSVAAGEAVTFTARMTAGTPGTIIFRDLHYPDQSIASTSTELGRVTLANGVANLTTGTLASGTHFITAMHDLTGTLATRVQKIHRSATSTVVSAPAGTQTSGDVRFTALVIGHAGGTPTGMITFQEGSRVLAQVALDNERTASVTLSNLGAPSRTITATYASDPLFASSTGTLTFPDTTPPSTPAGLAATPGPNANEVTLTWQPNPAADGIVVYEIWRDPPIGNATLAGVSITTTFVDAQARGSRLARYYLVAVDGTGNRSERSNIVWGRRAS